MQKQALYEKWLRRVEHEEGIIMTDRLGFKAS